MTKEHPGPHSQAPSGPDRRLPARATSRWSSTPAGRRLKLEVHNTGDRPIQVGSHFHFFEANRVLEFDREAAFGKRLDIPATTAVRFEPGDQKTVQLVPFGGKQRVYGFNGLVNGWTGDGPTPGYRPDRIEAIRRRRNRGFKSSAETQTRQCRRSRQAVGTESDIMSQISRQAVRRTCTARRPATRSGWATPTSTSRSSRTCGSSATRSMYGGGKTLRDGMGVDNQLTSAGGALDLVITNVTIIDAHARRRQGRRRHQGRQDRRHRQGRQPQHHGRRHPGPGHRRRPPTPSPAST